MFNGLTTVAHTRTRTHFIPVLALSPSFLPLPSVSDKKYRIYRNSLCQSYSNMVTVLDNKNDTQFSPHPDRYPRPRRKDIPRKARQEETNGINREERCSLSFIQPPFFLVPERIEAETYGFEFRAVAVKASRCIYTSIQAPCLGFKLTRYKTTVSESFFPFSVMREKKESRFGKRKGAERLHPI